MQVLIRQFERLSWWQWAFWGSLLLSSIAVLGAVTVGKDAAFYLDIAQRSLDQGPSVALEAFSWPWFSLLLAGLQVVTGLPLEVIAYIWCALCLAGTCALLVDAVQRCRPEVAPWACLVVLSVPAFNAFRDDIIREYGFWFFSVLALWLALRWQSRRGWLGAAVVQLSIGVAALFRLEAVMLALALNVCLLSELRQRSGWLALMQLNAIPFLAALGLGVVLLQQGSISQQRVEYFVGMLNPAVVQAKFMAMAQALSDAILNKYSESDAPSLLLSGMLGVIALAFIKLCGPLALPYLSRQGWSSVRLFWQHFKPFAVSALIYAGVLLVFFINERFINSRYSSFLNLLVVPLLGFGLMAFVRAHPRLGKMVVVLALLAMLDNVVSIGAKKTHYVEAGRWLSEHVQRGADIYYEDSRIAYYAGWGYPSMPMSRDQAMATENAGRFRYFLIEAKLDQPWLQSWLEREKRSVMSKFVNRKGATVLVIGEPGVVSVEDAGAQ